MYRLNDF